MIPELVGAIVRQEGKKFRQLQPEVDLDRIQAENIGVPREGISLYVHIPFCRSLCPFCCFNRYLFDEGKARRYFKDLTRELDMYRERGFSFSSVYFGGGTPTILMDELEEFINYLRIIFPVRELSLETTPRELSDDTIERLHRAGVNRLSVGVQSFQEPVLQTMGRTNGVDEEDDTSPSQIRGGLPVCPLRNHRACRWFPRRSLIAGGGNDRRFSTRHSAHFV